MADFQDLLSQLFDWVFSFTPSRPLGPKELNQIKFVAHRGAWDNHHILENTLEAFEKAKKLQAFGIEFDIRFTLDHVPVVIHDSLLKDSKGRELSVEKTNLKDLKKNFPYIPTFKEVLDQFEKKIHLMIEVKEPFEENPKNLEAFKNLLKAFDPVQDFHILSLCPKIFEDLKKDFPSSCFILVSELNCQTMFRLALSQEYGGFAGHYGLITNGKLKSLHNKGMKVGTGFISSLNILYREEHRKVEWVFTNHLEELRGQLDLILHSNGN